MKILVVTGGRDYDNENHLHTVLDGFQEQHHEHRIILLHGNATGADTLARKWAEQNSIRSLAFEADWQRFGKSAGPVRNLQMLRHAATLTDSKSDVTVIAFPGGRGTKNCVETARTLDITVLEIPNMTH